MGLIADMGKQELSARPWEDVDRGGLLFFQAPFDNIDIKFQVGHTYAVVIVKSQYRSGFFFEITNITGEKVEITYAVKFYEVHQVLYQSSGFSWNAGNNSTCGHP